MENLQRQIDEMIYKNLTSINGRQIENSLSVRNWTKIENLTSFPYYDQVISKIHNPINLKLISIL